MRHMDTQVVQKIKIDESLFLKELGIISDFKFSDTYKEFICGSWTSCMLYNRSGDPCDTAVFDYASQSIGTPYIARLSYINQLINAIFHISSLKFARLVLLGPNSVVIPHRDYLELNKDLLRFHIPLKTNDQCFNSEEDAVYHMAIGEVWYINATKIHSAGNFSSDTRMHLILDFDFSTSFSNILKDYRATAPLQIPEANIVKRSEFSRDFVEHLPILAKFMDIHTFYDIVSVLVKQHFYKKVHAAEMFDWLSLISEHTNEQQMREKISWLKKYCIKQR